VAVDLETGWSDEIPEESDGAVDGEGDAHGPYHGGGELDLFGAPEAMGGAEI
jgi:hypothetical protein